MTTTNVTFFSDLKKRLANWYIQEYSHVPFAPSRPENEVAMRQLYVAPKIVDKGQQPNKKSDNTVNTFNDFFKKEGSNCTNIFLLGEPGTGKSTFLQNLALQWSELHGQQEDIDRSDQLVAKAEHSYSDERRRSRVENKNEYGFQDMTTLEKIDVLFYVSLRDANKYCDYVDIINDQLLRNIYGEDEIGSAHSLVKRLLETPSSVVLSDGLDEWNHPSNEDCSCPARDKGRTPLIHQPSSATIVTTSRPWRLAQNAPRSSKVEKCLEIEGTSNAKKLGENVVAILNQQTEKLIAFRDVKKYVRKKGADNLMGVPILLLQIVCLYFDGEEVSNSQCKLYASIFDMMIGRHSQEFTEQRYTCESHLPLFFDKTNIELCWTQFLATAKLAFEKLFQQGHSSVVFNSKSCNLDNNVRTFARVCGLLTEKKSRSYSSSVSHLSFTHKTFQEFLAAVYMSINEELFETVIKPRYASCDQGSLERCLNDLAQVFRFTCGLNIHMAEKISTLFSSHYVGHMAIRLKTWHLDGKTTDSYSRVIQNGCVEADENGFKVCNFPLQCISFIIENEYDTIICCRLLEMNIDRLVSVYINMHINLIFNIIEKISIQGQQLIMCLQNCKRLQSLTLCKLDLGEEQLRLPDTLTYIELRDINVTGGIFLKNCTRLQHIFFNLVDFGDNMLLPDNLTNIELSNMNIRREIDFTACTMIQKLTLKHVNFGDNVFFLNPDQNFKHLQELKLVDVDLGDNELLLPNSITRVWLDSVSTAGGRNEHIDTRTELKAIIEHYLPYLGTLVLLECTQLQEITLKNINFCDNKLLLPDSIASINLVTVIFSPNWTVTVPLQHCMSLQKIEISNVFLGLNTNLPGNIIEMKLDFLSVCSSIFTVMQDLTQLQSISLADMDLSEIELSFPASVKTVELCELKIPKVLSLTECTRLKKLKIDRMDIAEKDVQLPDSITNIIMEGVTMSAKSLLEYIEHLKQLPHAVTFEMIYCNIEPLHENKRIIQRLEKMRDVQMRLLDKSKRSKQYLLDEELKINHYYACHIDELEKGYTRRLFFSNLHTYNISVDEETFIACEIRFNCSTIEI